MLNSGSIVEAGNDPYNYRFEWNKGWQPWCRSREKDNLFSWMRGIFIALGIIIILVLIFLCFWCAKRRRIDRVNSRRTSVSGRPPYYQKNGAYIPAGQKVPLPAEKNEVLVFENTPKAQMYSNGKGAKDLDDPHHGPAPNRANSSPPLHTDRPEWRDYPNRPPSGYSTPPRYNTPPYQNGNPAFQGFSNTRV
uniref:F54D1.6-like C-terminal Sushi-like domain-containing protein n=1 Tax=Plectus sambesii TaxID=2011161 RepID=A0A914V8B9_9BILA